MSHLVKPPFGLGYYFNGVAGKVEIPDSPSLQPDTYFTVVAWALVRTLPQVDYDHVPIIWRGNNIGWGNDYHFRIAIRSDGTVTWGSGGQDGAEYFFDGGNISDKLNQFVFYAYVADGATLRAYINAVEVATRGATPPYMVAGYKTYLGWANRNGVDVYVNGIVSEARMYSRVLTPEEISDLYNIGRNIMDDCVLKLGTVGLVRGGGTQWLDESGYGNHGTVYGAIRVRCCHCNPVVRYGTATPI